MFKKARGDKNLGRSMVKPEAEANPKVMRLEKLVQLIDPKVLAYYLEHLASFLENEKKDLWLPDISPQLDAFFVRVIKDVKNWNGLGLDSKSKIYAGKIINSLEKKEGVFSLVYNYDSIKFNNTVLVLKKIYSTTDTTAEFMKRFGVMSKLKSESSPTRDASTSDKKASKEDTESKLSNKCKALCNKKKIVESVDPLFAKAVFVQIYEFLSNDHEASVLFRNADRWQCQFLQNACSLAKTKKWHCLFEEEAKVYLSKIYNIINTAQRYTLSVQLEKGQKNSELRTVSILKEPIMSRPQNSSPVDFSAAEETKPKKKEKVVKEKAPEPKQEPEPSSSGNAAKEQPPKEEAAKGSCSSSQKVKEGDEKPGNSRKAKLLESMSIPVESDIALRMMRQMGWDGGPLGINGEGILEPIIPDLLLETGAGLGHVKQKSKKDSSLTSLVQFRTNLLTQILGLLRNKERIEVEIKLPLSRKKIKCTENTVFALNRRGHVKGKKVDVRILNQVVEEFEKDPDVTIECSFDENRQFLTLSKIQIPKMTLPLANSAKERNLIEKMTTINKILEEMPEIITSEYAVSIGKVFYQARETSQTVLAFGHRVILLQKIIELLHEKYPTCLVIVNYNLKVKWNRRLIEIITAINNREAIKMNTDIETKFYGKIFECVNDWYLNASVEGKRKIILKKSVDNPMIVAKKVSVCANSLDKINEIKQAIVESKAKNKESDSANGASRVVEGLIEDPIEESPDFENCLDAKALEDDLKNKKEFEKAIQEAVDCSQAYFNPDDAIDFEKKAEENRVVILRIAIKNSQQAREFQYTLSEKLGDYDKVLPLLECHGVRNGVLVYHCLNQIAVTVLKNVAFEYNMKVTVCFKELIKDNRRVVKMKLNSFIGVNLRQLFKLIELYNNGLSTDLWVVIDVQTLLDYVVVEIDVDMATFDYLSNKNFNVYAGYDRLYFSIFWFD